MKNILLTIIFLIIAFCCFSQDLYLFKDNTNSMQYNAASSAINYNNRIAFATQLYPSEIRMASKQFQLNYEKSFEQIKSGIGIIVRSCEMAVFHEQMIQFQYRYNVYNGSKIKVSTGLGIAANFNQIEIKHLVMNQSLLGTINDPKYSTLSLGITFACWVKGDFFNLGVSRIPNSKYNFKKALIDKANHYFIYTDVKVLNTHALTIVPLFSYSIKEDENNTYLTGVDFILFKKYSLGWRYEEASNFSPCLGIEISNFKLNLTSRTYKFENIYKSTMAGMLLSYNF